SSRCQRLRGSFFWASSETPLEAGKNPVAERREFIQRHRNAHRDGGTGSAAAHLFVPNLVAYLRGETLPDAVRRRRVPENAEATAASVCEGEIITSEVVVHHPVVGPRDEHHSGVHRPSVPEEAIALKTDPDAVPLPHFAENRARNKSSYRYDGSKRRVAH